MHPGNKNLLPPNFRSLLTDPKSPLKYPVDYYPETFDVDPYGCLFEVKFVCIKKLVFKKIGLIKIYLIKIPLTNYFNKVLTK